jgi:dTDP-4-dehydrorhamnose 3,5-epimerase
MDFLFLPRPQISCIKTTDYWFPEHECCIRWDDPTPTIDWKLQAAPIVSGKDAQGKNFSAAELFA